MRCSSETFLEMLPTCSFSSPCSSFLGISRPISSFSGDRDLERRSRLELSNSEAKSALCPTMEGGGMIIHRLGLRERDRRPPRGGERLMCANTTVKVTRLQCRRCEMTHCRARTRIQAIDSSARVDEMFSSVTMLTSEETSLARRPFAAPCSRATTQPLSASCVLCSAYNTQSTTHSFADAVDDPDELGDLTRGTR